MSYAAESAARIRTRSYLQSPLDDLESFYWVALWAVLFNVNNQKQRSPSENYWQRALVDPGHRYSVPRFPGYHPTDPELSPILQDWIPILRNWNRSIDAIQMSFLEVPDSSEGTDGRFYFPEFHRFALRGVAEVLEILCKHCERLKTEARFRMPTV